MISEGEPGACLMSLEGISGFENSFLTTRVVSSRAGTREVHNKLEKNRRAHLKECFELVKKQLPPSQDDKKASNLNILHSAIRFIQVWSLCCQSLICVLICF